ncbi:MAG: ABC transporter ATP-binding protein [Ruminococcaceae bacterium]|nr:ABC transporter ATP-binding protein [Oscillospiraceae bacterium]
MYLEIRGIGKSFGEKEVLKNISFKILSGRAMGFLGRNGSGKTTTLRCIMNIFKPNYGEILLDGSAFNPKKNRVGYLPEERGLYYKEKILDQLIYFGQLRGFSRNDSRDSSKFWIERFGLGEYSDKKLETLSKGNQQKVQIAQAFVNNPDIIILDEPFSGLDPVNAEVFKDVIKESVKEGKLVLFSSHQMGYVEEFCDDITLIDDGKIILSDDLMKVKENKSRGKYRIEADNIDREEFKRIIENKFPVSISNEDKISLIIDMEGKNSNEFLSALIDEKVRIKVFSTYIPSLNEIFIEEVGGDA